MTNIISFRPKAKPAPLHQFRIYAAEMQVRPAETHRARNRSATPCLARPSSIGGRVPATMAETQERSSLPSDGARREACVPGVVEGRPTEFKRKRHRWSDPVRFTYKTERTCLNGCGITKVTRHEPGILPWQEFWRGLDKLPAGKTPACEGGEA